MFGGDCLAIRKIKLDDTELEIEKIESKVCVSQVVTVLEADNSEHEEHWLIAKGQIATPESRAS